MATGQQVEWEASHYDRLADPHERWALDLIDRLALQPGERLLDAGCGSGRVTRLLCERLASLGGDWQVLGVDASAEMLEQARGALAEYGAAVELQRSDLLELDLAEGAGDEPWRRPVDAVFSSAVFHWIADHDALFRRVYGWLRPGGRLVAQCGGTGNVREWQDATREAMDEPEFRADFEGWQGPWTFVGPEETVERLERAGFVVTGCRLEEKPTAVEDGRTYLRVVGLAAHLARLDESRHESFVDAVFRRVPNPNTLRYVRLNIEASRPPETSAP